MRCLSSLVAWRYTFLASLGLLSACGGETKGSPASVGTGGTPSGQGGQGTGGELPASSGGSSSMPESSGGSSEMPEGTGGSPGASGGMSSGGAGPRCENSKPILTPDGQVTGFETCQDGLVHRPDAVSCPSGLPRSDVSYEGAWTGDCARDTDCTAAAFGFCEPQPGQLPVTRCNYGCVTDSDCPSGNLCECGPRFGVCTPTNCATNADCGDALCAKNHDPGRCADDIGGGLKQFACTTPQDTCRVDDDCMTHRCAYSAGLRSCAEQGLCGIGRPFLVDGTPRTAALGSGVGWLPLEATSSTTTTPNSRVAEHYQRAALLEHASVAAFARFTLELLALGAPAELVEAATQAMVDETLHARLCFGLASRYSGRALGPGPLAVSDALGSAELERIVANVVLEGCVGESVAAEEAARSLQFAEDPEARTALTRIAADERRHAELAFRFVDWALSKRPELAGGVRALVLREVAATKGARAATDDIVDLGAREALAHGVFPDGWRAALRASVLREFVLPCLEALCGRRPYAEPAQVAVAS